MATSSSVHFPSAWWATAAYLWILRCDRPALAWEYLRRNPDYRQECPEGIESGVGAARRWELAAYERATSDARDTQPIWSRPPTDVRALGRSPDGQGALLSVWRLPGCKALLHDGKELLLCIVRGACTVRLALVDDFVDGEAMAWLVPVGARSTWTSIPAHDAWLSGGTSRAGVMARSLPIRTAITHMYTLQALDGVLAGASQREIARVLFGAERVDRSWRPDGDLRARTRFLIRRGLALMRGGYVDLLRGSERSAQRMRTLRGRPGNDSSVSESP